MERPIAYRHLARMHEMVTSASIARVVTDRQLLEHSAMQEAASNDRAADEEIQSLARERGWTLPEVKPFEWKLVLGLTTVMPRVLRVLARDQFELDEIRRRTDDEEVASLASTLYNERHATARALEAEHPEFTLPGAK